MTAENAGKLGKGAANTAKLLGGPEIEHYHQAIALVVAETFEQARAAAQLVRVDYVAPRAPSTSPRRKNSAEKPSRASVARRYGGRRFRRRLRRSAGQARRDLQHAGSGARDDGAARLDRGLGRRPAHALDVEPDDRLGPRRHGAQRSASPKDKVRLISPFIGGGFGGKLLLRADALLAALGARAAGRPVKVALPRPLIFNNTTHRPATIQRIRIGATHDGKITAIGHESWSGNLPGGETGDAPSARRGFSMPARTG